MTKILFICPTFILLSANPVWSKSIPSGFKVVESHSGVEFYQRSLLPNRSEYVTVVNLNRANVTNIIGKIDRTTDSRLERRYLTDFWDSAKQENTKLRVLLNGAFFSQKLDPAPIAFGLKVAGSVVSYGYGLDEFPGLIKIWGFDAKSSFIIDYKDLNSFDSYAQNLVGALDAKANKSASKYLPRTFVGVQDRDGDGVKETVVFYSSNAARQIDAVLVLDSFGAKEKVMLDGGSSTGLIINGVAYIKPNRTIPHAIAIYTSR